MAPSAWAVLVVSLLFGRGSICKPSFADKDLVAKDTGAISDINSLSKEVEDIEYPSYHSDDGGYLENERQEAIKTGTYSGGDPAEDERKEAIESGSFENEPRLQDERKEAIESGTYTADSPYEETSVSESDNIEKQLNEIEAVSNDSGNENESSWLPPKASVAEEIALINEADGSKGLVDGDILPPPMANNDVEEMDNENEKRNALRNREKIWRRRVIPYYFDGSLDSGAVQGIKGAISEYEQKTCIRFKEVSMESSEHYIRFFRGGGCYSYVGLIGGKSQDISIGSGCVHKGIILHELMHALGFYHEQSRYDRDQYVSIDYSNIKSGREINFKKRTIGEVTSLGLPYDYDGIMHYGQYAFAKDRSKPTIVKLKSTGGPIGQRNGLSATDLKQLNILYDCKTDSVKNSWSSWSSWSSCIDLGSGNKEHSQRFCFEEDLSKCIGSNGRSTQSRERICQFGTTSVPVVTIPAKVTTKPSNTGNTVNEAICGTRGRSLAHPVMDPQHIVGGSQALPGDWPWQVGIASLGSNFIYCGGTLISDQWVVGAAHCFSAKSLPSRITARLGDHNSARNEGTEQIVRLKKVIIHPLYDSNTVDYDIALLQLSRPVSYTNYIRPACIASAGLNLADGIDAFVSGWGTTSEGGSTSPILNVAKVPMISNARCSQTLRITDRMVCAGYVQGGIDACQGDSGGPLVVKNSKGKFELVGVVSWGIGCARRNRPGVYAKVSALRNFIDKELMLVAPKPTPTTGSPYNQVKDLLPCNFEKGLCQWKQSSNDNFDWSRRSGATPSRNTGPTSSSTGSRGFYVYIEASYPRRNGDVATLMSPLVKSSIPTCLSFKAHMLGRSMGSLKIEKLEGSQRTELFEKGGNQGNKWMSLKVDLPSGGPYKVAISGVRVHGYQGDIAIDELQVELSSCKFPLSLCTFENDLCRWSQSKTDDFDWTRMIGSTRSPQTGPSGSSTGPGDAYLYIETSQPRKRGNKATLISPEIRWAGPGCLSFKAHMYGRGIGSLKVEKLEGSQRTELFEKVGNQGNKWLTFKVDLPSGGPYKIAITGIRGFNYQGDIAIDELSLRNRSCNGKVKPTTSPAKTQAPAGQCGKPQIAASRVIAGKDAVRGSWPWQILMTYLSTPSCGGTLISPTVVVTTAKCVYGRESQANKFSVRVGEHDRRIKEGSEVDIPVAKIISHPLSAKYTMDYDIAIVKLARPATLGKYVLTACLPAANDEPPVGSDCYITGFGKIKHPGRMHHTLQQAKIAVVSQKTCKDVNTKLYGISITERMICAGNGPQSQQSGCHGDGGGPLVCQKNGKWYLQGAVSWGARTCSAAMGYTVFAKISNPAINGWIRQHVTFSG